MNTGAWVAVAVVLLVGAFGLWRALTDGRFRSTASAPVALAPRPGDPREPSPGVGLPWSERLGERATLVQFSSAFCAPCRTTRTVLADVAAHEDGVTHVEVDAEQQLDLVRRLSILRTPTTLILDADGVEVGRAVGAPTRDQVRKALSALP